MGIDPVLIFLTAAPDFPIILSRCFFKDALRCRILYFFIPCGIIVLSP